VPRASSWSWVTTGLVALAVCGCDVPERGQGAPRRLPDLLRVTIDTLRPDPLGIYGRYDLRSDPLERERLPWDGAAPGARALEAAVAADPDPAAIATWHRRSSGPGAVQHAPHALTPEQRSQPGSARLPGLSCGRAACRTRRGASSCAAAPRSRNPSPIWGFKDRASSCTVARGR